MIQVLSCNLGIHRTRLAKSCSSLTETDDIDAACGEHSGCINRLTQVECVASECRCGPHCQNQSFQKREFGPVEIVQTEKKGFGMRATADIARDTFIYEYVGDVIGEKKFTQRMQEYYDEGVIHFYFMMLQKDEVGRMPDLASIDGTS
jgi:histone-lysine N-methyltransferase SETD2